MAEGVSVGKLAEFLNITPRRVQQLVKEGMPQLGRGRYSPVPCAHWYIRYLQKAVESRAGATGATGGTDIVNERKLLIIEKRRLAAMEADEMAGNLLPADDVQIVVNQAMVTLRAEMDGLPGRVAAELAGMTEAALIRQYLLNEHRRILTSVADKYKLLADIGRGSRDRQAAAEPDAERMGETEA